MDENQTDDPGGSIDPLVARLTGGSGAQKALIIQETSVFRIYNPFTSLLWLKKIKKRVVVTSEADIATTRANFAVRQSLWYMANWMIRAFILAAFVAVSIGI